MNIGFDEVRYEAYDIDRRSSLDIILVVCSTKCVIRLIGIPALQRTNRDVGIPETTKNHLSIRSDPVILNCVQQPGRYVENLALNPKSNRKIFQNIALQKTLHIYFAFSH